ncbi:hypothetical protein SKAU_G00412340 [Synaphobranchus kaupii]|uniref:PiggyBac transposable element-derived protein domain-containing protein n=1 Tax=Synaphobranchus kaupii TaxID=118154 RepID=A0A9Q1IB27_SYNKA|nr:hypothetical protein SKAU_G00412340 [Synaphobranchus kaupii]
MAQRKYTAKEAMRIVQQMRDIDDTDSDGGDGNEDETMIYEEEEVGNFDYMANKPDKFGIKFRMAVDVETKYLLNGFPFLGKDCTRSLENLLHKKTTLVGTANKQRWELPPSARNQKAERYSMNVMKKRPVTLTIYQGKPSKNDCIMSTMNPTVTTGTDPKRKPETVEYYNSTKFGVDIMDQMARNYTARGATRRWPVAVFYNILDLAAINAYVLFKTVPGQKHKTENVLPADAIGVASEPSRREASSSSHSCHTLLSHQQKHVYAVLPRLPIQLCYIIME